MGITSMCTQRISNKYFLLGSVFMVQASVSRLLLQHSHTISESAKDGTVGVLYGITIGFYLLALIKGRRDGDVRAAR
jgi:hypothetical protein